MGDQRQVIYLECKKRTLIHTLWRYSFAVLEETHYRLPNRPFALVNIYTSKVFHLVDQLHDRLDY